MIGRVLNKQYRVEEFIGRGGMADVYKVWDLDKNVHLAIKLLHSDLAEDKVFQRRFKREAHTLEELQHPHIVRYYGQEQDRFQTFLVMDFVDGKTLRSKIFRARETLSEHEINRIMNAVCSALQYAHNRNLIHCDLKPANIMISNNGTVLLMDFGITRMAEATTATLVGAGTPAYMAPEQIRGEEPVFQTDIYALGVILFEILTGGERPFTGENAETTGTTRIKILWEQMNLEPPSPRKFNPAINPQLEAVVMRCLQKRPEDRYASALEFYNALESALGYKTSVDSLKIVGDWTTTAESPQLQPYAGTIYQPSEVYETDIVKDIHHPPPVQMPRPPISRQATAPPPMVEAKKKGPPRWLWAAGGFLALLVVVCVVLGIGLLISKQDNNPLSALFANSPPTHTATPTSTILPTISHTATNTQSPTDTIIPSFTPITTSFSPIAPIPSETFDFVPTATAEATGFIQSTATPINEICDQASYIADVTIPDFTQLLPGVSFTKTWRIKNSGLCTWTTDYDFIFWAGDQMGGPIEQALSNDVLPGETVDISINMVAPATVGTYQGDWKLRNSNGEIFSTEFDNTFFIIIQVVETVATTNP